MPSHSPVNEPGRLSATTGLHTRGALRADAVSSRRPRICAWPAGDGVQRVPATHMAPVREDEPRSTESLSAQGGHSGLHALSTPRRISVVARRARALGEDEAQARTEARTRALLQVSGEAHGSEARMDGLRMASTQNAGAEGIELESLPALSVHHELRLCRAQRVRDPAGVPVFKAADVLRHGHHRRVLTTSADPLADSLRGRSLWLA
jgi:hypothetical protein